MRSTLTATLLLGLGLALGQSPKEAVDGIFSSDPQLPGYEVVPEKPSESLGALQKCGEGDQAGAKLCVPYYMCDGKTSLIVQTGKTDGFGIIDIRFGANSCKHPLDVCCGVPTEGPPPTTAPDQLPTPSPTSPPAVTPREDEPVYCGIGNPNGIDFKITGNKNNEAEYGEFPWMVAILKKNYNPAVDPVLAVCGGSLIAPNVVLTGAHCVYKFKTHEIKIRAGEWDTQTEKERLPYQERDVASIIVHDNFNPQTLFNDIALLVLTDTLAQADNIGTVCLPNHGQVIDSKQCFASGWGRTAFGKEGVVQVILKKVELPIVPHDQCQSALRETRLGNHFQLDSSFTCAGGEEGKDTCTGDGGSPLVCPDPNNPNRYVQAGIVAWGIGCAESNVPGVYADVSKFRDWVDENMQRLNLDTAPYRV